MGNSEQRQCACSVKLVEAALQASAAHAEEDAHSSAADAWARVAAQAVGQLQAACRSQSDHKKAFKIVVTRLLVPVLKMDPKRGKLKLGASPLMRIQPGRGVDMNCTTLFRVCPGHDGHCCMRVC